jgi:predicted phage baseplate assembly protein
MPLETLIPAIDNRRFDDIVSEARARIARYTPEWTPVWSDVNDSDPGITLVQVFAWVADMLLYRMSKVPELNYLKFLQLIGIELNPAQPARVEIEFPVKPSTVDPYVIVPIRTQVSAQASDGGPPIVFETDRSLFAVTAALAAVQVFDGFAFPDETAVNQDAQDGFAAFGPTPAKGNALMIGFDYAGAFPQVELNLAFRVVGAPASANNNCGLPESALFPSVVLGWQYWNGSAWIPLNLLKDETVALQRSGHVYLKTPTPGQMKTASLGSVAATLYWIRAEILSGAYEKSPVVQALRTNTVSATQAQTIENEILGGSDGSPNQTFTLANQPVLAGTLDLQVDEGSGLEKWTEVSDFFGSSSTDRVYVLDRTMGQVRFGDGQSSAIPVANVDNPNGNMVALAYRFGGGKRGNVPAGALTTMLVSVAGIDEAKVSNLFPASGGSDEETLDKAKLRAPRALKSQCRAVTAEDFELLATQAGNVARAHTIPLANPAFPGVKVPGAVTVVIVPDGNQPNPMPTDGLIRTVCAYLNQRRLLTTELYIVKPQYQKVEVRAEVVAGNSADLAELKLGIEAALIDYFHPLKGGDAGQGWPFGGEIFFSRVYQRVLSVPGAQRINTLTIVLDGTEYPPCTDVPIAPDALLFSTEHQIQVSYAFEV